MTRERTNALFVAPDLLLFFLCNGLVALALTHRVPTMFELREYVETGGLVSYGANVIDLLRRGATMVE